MKWDSVKLCDQSVLNSLISSVHDVWRWQHLFLFSLIDARFGKVTFTVDASNSLGCYQSVDDSGLVSCSASDYAVCNYGEDC